MTVEMLPGVSGLGCIRRLVFKQVDSKRKMKTPDQPTSQNACFFLDAHVISPSVILRAKRVLLSEVTNMEIRGCNIFCSNQEFNFEMSTLEGSNSIIALKLRWQRRCLEFGSH